MPDTPPQKSDTRVCLDDDNRDRYTQWAQSLGLSREWLVNHALRIIAKNATLTTEMESTSGANIQVGQKRLIIKKTMRDSHTF